MTASHPSTKERTRVLERIADLATELCISIDRQAEDIGGSRKPMTILRDIGPLTDQWEAMSKSGSRPADLVRGRIRSSKKAKRGARR